MSNADKPYVSAKPDIKILVEWLGLDGAVAGLERSLITNAELMILAREHGLTVDKKTARKQIVIELVMGRVNRIDKPVEYLLGMSADEIHRYLVERMVSNAEIIRLLEDLGIPPRGKTRAKLSEFASQEISDLGMFQRVAKGGEKGRSPER